MIVPLASMTILSLFGATPPSPGPGRPKTWSRNIDCERLTAEIASRRYPGEIDPPSPRGDYIERSAIVCRERLLRAGMRPVRDEAILSTLERLTVELAETAASLRPDLADRTWLVEAFYPSAPVTGKIAFATKNALMGHGLRVSDRTPVLGARDVDVITRMHPDQAYPTACRRWSETGGLDDDDALLAVISRDPRETILHAGLCASGVWTWLR